jgi:transcriptional regulator with XRE-family HTH domain
MKKSISIKTVEEISGAVKIFRQKKKLSAYRLAKNVGCAEGTISRIESGQIIPSPAMLLRILRELGADLRIQAEPKVHGSGD